MKSSNRLANKLVVLALSLSVTPSPALAQRSASPPAQANAADTLTINITGARNAKGKVIVWLFRDPQGFPSDVSKIFRKQSVGIDVGTMTAHVVFKDLPPGPLAVTVLHDENANGKMGKNFLGIPREGYGASNNPKVKRAPTFDEARFSLRSAQQVVEVKLGYF